ncbi:5622_t:CDS:2 [Entrophospora sp. SA101]|nr:10957_t:CDS:2 [Entrophospora sp. SA101]CAJ0761395.1 5622_t:CDS:2 [Entrophospora sp. SA101]CAJ0903747.1 1247_t:CDS:2 [Entrophospora sp. SA101]
MNNPSNDVNSLNQRSVFFIDASNPEIANQTISTSSSHPFVKPPFPPVIDVRELITKQNNGKLPTRSPNAFIIYRKVFLDTAQADGYTLPMTVISAMVSKSWESEPQYVKDEYKKLAKEAFNRLNEMNPKSTKPNKRERWNFVSFDQKNKSSKPRLNKNVKQPGNKNENRNKNSKSSVTIVGNNDNNINNTPNIANTVDLSTFDDHDYFNNNNITPLLSFSPSSTNSSPNISSNYDLFINNIDDNDKDIFIQNMLDTSSFTANLNNSQNILNQYLNPFDQDISPDIDNTYEQQNFVNLINSFYW